MARSLLLMRHAKSDWNDSSLPDKDRPLNARGQSTAPFMADFLATNNLLPDLILCSGAVRTRQTLELMLERWTGHFESNQGLAKPKLAQPEVIIEDRLYLASDETILSIARSYPNIDSKHRVMMLGHNPGMEILASRLSQHHVEMPTAAIVLVASNEPNGSWPADWNDVKRWSWQAMFKPKDLAN